MRPAQIEYVSVAKLTAIGVGNTSTFIFDLPHIKGIPAIIFFRPLPERFFSFH